MSILLCRQRSRSKIRWVTEIWPDVESAEEEKLAEEAGEASDEWAAFRAVFVG